MASLPLSLLDHWIRYSESPMRWTTPWSDILRRTMALRASWQYAQILRQYVRSHMLQASLKALLQRDWRAGRPWPVQGQAIRANTGSSVSRPQHHGDSRCCLARHVPVSSAFLPCCCSQWRRGRPSHLACPRQASANEITTWVRHAV
jgi:hypothetical protein